MNWWIGLYFYMIFQLGQEKRLTHDYLMVLLLPWQMWKPQEMALLRRAT